MIRRKNNYEKIWYNIVYTIYLSMLIFWLNALRFYECCYSCFYYIYKVFSCICIPRFFQHHPGQILKKKFFRFQWRLLSCTIMKILRALMHWQVKFEYYLFNTYISGNFYNTQTTNFYHLQLVPRLWKNLTSCFFR